MGNCINFMSHPPHGKIKVVIRKGGQRKFKASTPLDPVKVYHVVPDLAILLGKPLVPSKLVRQEGYKRKKIKIVVTREELELLLKSANKPRSKENGVRLSGRFGLEPPKWQPCLAIIPEVHHF
ncbi:hypothetical protein D8674_039923 [Pyrus ussuriensis x Pyrus communis]|uniref:Uncharacterized protein n=1 Tax=Pyrus ussuriensis x Pyrus communis TaxID=2448454 RepID=A0A5N5HE43_9ROSA|nr:hypothetical protein D8674_039923 [Pyrus ussuriensis x Pyrus communis]